MKIIFMGTPIFAIPALKALIKSEHDIELVITQPDKPYGRKKILTPSPIKELALAHSLAIFQPQKLNDDYSLIEKINPDLIITCAFGQLISSQILEIPKYGCINIHASLLPFHRGGDPIRHAILNGDTKTGISLMFMDEQMDHGDIIYQKELLIEKFETYSELYENLSQLGGKVLTKHLSLIEKFTNLAFKQDHQKATYAYNLKSDDEKLNFNDSVTSIVNKIRAFDKVPGAYGIFNEKRIKMFGAKIHNLSADSNLKNGQIISIDKDGLKIKANDGYLTISHFQIEGKTIQKASEFQNIRLFENGVLS